MTIHGLSELSEEECPQIPKCKTCNDNKVVLAKRMLGHDAAVLCGELPTDVYFTTEPCPDCSAKDTAIERELGRR